MDGLTKLIEALAQVLKAVAWPSFATFVIWKLLPSLRLFLENISELNWKGAGIEISAKRNEVAEALINAQSQKVELASGTSKTISPERVAASITTANARVTRSTLRRLMGKCVLWVDDNPSNNVWERKALEALGIRVRTAISTEEALQFLVDAGYTILTISDMYRAGDSLAGYHLINQIRARSLSTQVLIYAGSATPTEEQEAISRGAIGRISDPEELVRMVTDFCLSHA